MKNSMGCEEARRILGKVRNGEPVSISQLVNAQSHRENCEMCK